MDFPQHVNLFVIAIKLGTKTCGFTFQAVQDFKNDPIKGLSKIFNTGSTYSDAFPTSLFLARNGDVSFGYEAQHIFTDSGGRGRGVFFGNFVESLYLSEVCYFHD